MSINYVLSCQFCSKKFKTKCGLVRHETKQSCAHLQFQCELCLNRFTSADTLSHHRKHTCRVVRERKTEYEELVIIKKQLDLLKTELENKDKEILLLKQKDKQPQFVQINNNIMRDQINFHINSHGKERMESIDFGQIVKMILSLNNPSRYNQMIPNLMKKVNIDTKENRNVYLPNIRANYGLVLEDNTWNIKKMEPLLNDLVMDNVDRLYDFIQREEELFVKHISRPAYNELKINMDKYFDKVSDNQANEKSECMKRIKDILITNRHIVSAFYEEITGEKIGLPK